MLRLLKRVGKIAGWSILGFLLLAGTAVWWERDALKTGAKEWERDYRMAALQKAMVTEVAQLPPVDEVVVFRLADEPVSPGQKPFYKTYYGSLVYEAGKIILTGPKAEALATLWRSEPVHRNGAACHEPHHALRFFHQGKQISQAMICFYCANAEIPCCFLGGELTGFELDSPQYAALKKQVEELVGAAP